MVFQNLTDSISYRSQNAQNFAPVISRVVSFGASMFWPTFQRFVDQFSEMTFFDKTCPKQIKQYRKVVRIGPKSKELGWESIHKEQKLAMDLFLKFLGPKPLKNI